MQNVYKSKTFYAFIYCNMSEYPNNIARQRQRPLFGLITQKDRTLSCAVFFKCKCYLLLILKILAGDNVLVSISVKVTRNTIDHDRRNIAADQRTDITDELFCYICAFLIDP